MSEREKFLEVKPENPSEAVKNLEERIRSIINDDKLSLLFHDFPSINAIQQFDYYVYRMQKSLQEGTLIAELRHTNDVLSSHFSRKHETLQLNLKLIKKLKTGGEELRKYALSKINEISELIPQLRQKRKILRVKRKTLGGERAKERTKIRISESDEEKFSKNFLLQRRSLQALSDLPDPEKTAIAYGEGAGLEPHRPYAGSKKSPTLRQQEGNIDDDDPADVVGFKEEIDDDEPDETPEL